VVTEETVIAEITNNNRIEAIIVGVVASRIILSTEVLLDSTIATRLNLDNTITRIRTLISNRTATVHNSNNKNQ
jgi:hypothetical protein